LRISDIFTDKKKEEFCVSSFSFLSLIDFSRARPELVEGYHRALEDILQQVQDERRMIEF